MATVTTNKPFLSLFQQKKKTISTDFMAKEELQCTSHLLPKSDESYEEGWLRERFDKLTLTHTFWAKHKCAVSVSLTPAQWNIMYYSVPHIPLAKHTSDSWDDLRPVMKLCKSTGERQQTSNRSIIFFTFTAMLLKKGDIFCEHTKNSQQ